MSPKTHQSTILFPTVTNQMPPESPQTGNESKSPSLLLSSQPLPAPAYWRTTTSGTGVFCTVFVAKTLKKCRGTVLAAGLSAPVLVWQDTITNRLLRALLKSAMGIDEFYNWSAASQQLQMWEPLPGCYSCFIGRSIHLFCLSNLKSLTYQCSRLQLWQPELSKETVTPV